ncbi:hypothetical protein Aperf_G00000132690 [Anoplocephala perfoliata]
MAAANSEAECATRENKFESLLKDIEVGGLSKSYVIDLTLGEVDLDLSEARSFKCGFAQVMLSLIAIADKIVIIGGKTANLVSVSQEEVPLFDAERRTNPVKYFNQLRRKDKFTDLTIMSREDQPFRAHRIVICAQFPSIINCAVEFAHTGRIRINLLNVVQLYLLSQNLGCARLMAWCIDFMKLRMVSLNLNEMWSVANVTAMRSCKVSVCA